MPPRPLTALLALALVSANHPADNPHSVVTPADLKWKDGPASLPKGAQVVVLEGDPTKPGEFVMRVKLPDGMRIMPHTHPKVERVTVLSGTLYLGMGDTFDLEKVKEMPAGSYGRTGADMTHFGYVKGETVLQLHGTGPWAVVYVNPADDPRANKVDGRAALDRHPGMEATGKGWEMAIYLSPPVFMGIELLLLVGRRSRSGGLFSVRFGLAGCRPAAR